MVFSGWLFFTEGENNLKAASMFFGDKVWRQYEINTVVMQRPSGEKRKAGGAAKAWAAARSSKTAARHRHWPGAGGAALGWLALAQLLAMAAAGGGRWPGTENLLAKIESWRLAHRWRQCNKMATSMYWLIDCGAGVAAIRRLAAR